MSVLQPTNEELHQVVNIIRSAMDHTNRAQMEMAVSFIDTHSSDAKFSGCLAVIAAANEIEETTKAQAALALKNSIKRFYKEAVEPNLGIIRPFLLNSLSSSSGQLSTSLSQCIIEIAANEGWDQILYEIWPQYEQSQNESFRRSLLTIIKYLCEDSAYVFENPDATNPSISQAHSLIPRLINVVTVSQAPAEVELALTAVYNLMAYKSEMESSPIYLACGQFFPQLLESWERCLSLSEQPGQLLSTTLDCYRLSLYYYDQLKQSNKLDAILQLMYRYATPGQVPPPIALKACEFWMDLVGHSELAAPGHATSAVQGLLEKDLIPGLVKLLLDNMCFSDAEVSEIMEEEQADQVKPKWINEEDDAVEQWTLRTCSAQTLDNLAQKISHAVVNPPGKAAGWMLNEEVLPRLVSDDWKKQESAMLALGCISKGCTEVVVPSLSRLVPEMLNLVKDENRHFLMRSITLWTLGRYMEWISQSPLCEATLQTLLEGMTAPRRKVQEGSVSSFAELMLWENKVKGLLTQHPEYLEPVFHKVSVCLQPGNYTIRNLVMLLDACRSIIAAFGETMQEKIDACILKPMIECHFMTLPADDKTLFPHIACCILHSFPIMPAIFPKYAEKVFRKCIDVTGQHFRDALHFAQTGQEVPNTDMGAWLVMSIMKMIVGLVYEQDKAFADNLVLNIKFEGSNYNFIDFLLMPFTQADIYLEPTYVTEAENFIGDYLSVYPERLIEPMLGNLAQLLSYISVSDNLANDTSWLCGELVLSMQGRFTDEQIHQATKQMANKVVPVLLDDVNYFDNTRQNAALAIGKWCTVCPDMFADQLHTFFKPLVDQIGLVPEFNSTVEKTTALRGLLACISKKFEILQHIENVATIARCMTGSRQCMIDNPDLMGAFVSLTKSLKQAFGAQWDAEVTKQVSFPASVLKFV